MILPAQLRPAKPGLQSQIPVDVSQIPCDELVQSSGQVRSKDKRDKYIHTTYSRNIMCQKCGGICGLWVLN